MNALVPPIGTNGLFNFSTPYDTLLPNVKYRVESIRELSELLNSEEKPYELIYQPVNLTKADFNEDVKNKIPIVVLSTDGKKYTYVPANRIISIPLIAGVKYQEKILAISLGSIPDTLDLSTISGIVHDNVYDVIGVDSTVKTILASNIVYKSSTEHDVFTNLLANRATVNKSYKTLYTENLQLLAEEKTKNQALEKYIKEKL